MCHDVYAWWPDSGSGAEWQCSEGRFRSLCGRIRISLAPCAAFGLVLSTSRWENIVDTTDLSKSTCCRLGPDQCGKVPSQGEYSESSTHVQAVFSTVGLAKSACGYDCEQLLLALDHSEELFPK